MKSPLESLSHAEKDAGSGAEEVWLWDVLQFLQIAGAAQRGGQDLRGVGWQHEEAIDVRAAARGVPEQDAARSATKRDPLSVRQRGAGTRDYKSARDQFGKRQ